MKPLERIEESRTVRLGDAHVSFLLRRSNRRRSIGIQVDENGLTVSVPWRCSEQRLHNTLQGAEAWVLRKLAAWTREQVFKYISDRKLPYNELHDRNYPTVGCTHCTKPVNGSKPWDYSREGRWVGFNKTECGLNGGAGI
jgi:hypothetical protein